MKIKEIVNDGFFIKDTDPKVKNIAFLSLTMALKAYFSTYKSMSFHFSHLKNASPDSDDRDFYSAKYIENACEAIFHLQHFFELFIKEILEKEHILLAIDVKKNHALLYDLIKGINYDESELEKERQLEFSEAFQRIISLIETGRIDNDKYGFIKDSKECLNNVNTLRNRIVHRGVFILRYQALDFLFGKHVFPFLKEVLSLEGNKKRYTQLQGYNELGKFSIIDSIINHFEHENYSIPKVALLKEFGRACFENPIRGKLGIGQKEKKRAKLIAEEVSKLEDIGEVLICPVCETESLVKYHDYVETYDCESGEYAGDIQIVYKVTCYCCSLELFSNIGEINSMNLGLKDYWKID
jgi:hypothetical protein